MKVIGLTGGIASGKSLVSSILKELGGVVIDADVVAREIVEIGNPALKEIEANFGKKALNEDGTLNRKYLGNIVFNNSKKLKLLNEITHPRIIRKIKDMVNYYNESGKLKIIFIDSPLLIEMNMHTMVDEVWLVVVEKEKQIKRLMKRDNISLHSALIRIDNQMPLDEKKLYADILINNSGDIEELREHVLSLWNKVFGGV